MTANSAPASCLATSTSASCVEARRVEVALGEGRDADAEVAALADQRDQLDGVGEPALGRRPRRAGPSGGSPRSAMTCCDARVGVGRRGSRSSSARVCPTQVRCATGSSEVSRAIRPVMRDGRVAGAAAGAVGHRDERRPVGLQGADRLPQLLLAGLVLGREELERERALAAARAARACSVRVPWSWRTSLGSGGAAPVRGSVAACLGSHRERRRVGPRRRSATGSRRRSTPSSTSRPSGWRRWAPTPRGWSPRRARRSPAASGSGRRSATGATSPSPRRRRPTTTRWSGPAPRWSCCTPAPWSTTTTWTPPTPGAAGRRPTARSRREHRARRLARRPRAVRRRRARSCSATCCSSLVRRAAAPLRAAAADGSRPALDVFDLCRTEVIAGQFLDVSVQARGHADVDTAMTVLRYKSAKYSIERPLHIGAALAGADARRTIERADRVRAAAGRGVPAARRPARRVRRPGGDRQAGRRRPGRGQAHRAGRAGARRRSGAADAARSTPRSARR